MKVDLRGIEKDVLHIIAQRTAGNPIKGREIADMVGVPVREVREIISNLVKKGFKIGRSNEGKMGYYLIRTPWELEREYNSLKRRALEILTRASKLKDVPLSLVLKQILNEVKAKEGFNSLQKSLFGEEDDED